MDLVLTHQGLNISLEEVDTSRVKVFIPEAGVEGETLDIDFVRLITSDEIIDDLFSRYRHRLGHLEIMRVPDVSMRPRRRMITPIDSLDVLDQGLIDLGRDLDLDGLVIELPVKTGPEAGITFPNSEPNLTDWLPQHLSIPIPDDRFAFNPKACSVKLLGVKGLLT